MPRFSAAEAADIHTELLDSCQIHDELLQRTRERVRCWKFTNLAPDPISPPGILEAVDLDLHLTDEFVRPPTKWKRKATDHCHSKVGFDELGRQILEEGGSPRIWDYRDDAVLEYSLSGDLSRCRLRKRPQSSDGPAQLQVSCEAVLVRYQEQQSDTQLHVTSEHWQKSDGGFELDNACTFAHTLIFNQAGLVRIETDTILNGVKAGRQISWQRRGLLSRMISGLGRG